MSDSITDVKWIATEYGRGAVVTPVREIARVTACGCWVITLGQGHGFLPCGVHEEAILKIVETKPVLPDASTKPKEPQR